MGNSLSLIVIINIISDDIYRASGSDFVRNVNYVQGGG